MINKRACVLAFSDGSKAPSHQDNRRPEDWAGYRMKMTAHTLVKFEFMVHDALIKIASGNISTSQKCVKPMNQELLGPEEEVQTVEQYLKQSARRHAVQPVKY